MERWVGFFLLGQFLAIFAWRMANAVLIDTLQRYYKSSHQAAGAPDMSFIANCGPFNARWAAHILFLRFKGSLPTTPYLEVPFWIAFAAGWYIALGLALVLLVALGLVELGA